MESSTDVFSVEIFVFVADRLEHVYQFEDDAEIVQMKSIDERFFFYRTSTKIRLFEINFPTKIFQSTESVVRSLKIFSDGKENSRLVALFDDGSASIVSPVTAALLTSHENSSKKSIRTIFHDVEKLKIFSKRKSENFSCIFLVFEVRL